MGLPNKPKKGGFREKLWEISNDLYIKSVKQDNKKRAKKSVKSERLRKAL